jgi:hypothetical protein
MIGADSNVESMYELVSLVMSAAAIILITLFAFWLYLGLPWDMAKARKRQPLLGS